MKIMLFFAAVSAIMPFECCFCKGKADGVLAVDNRRDVVRYSPCLVSLSSVKQSKIFFESLSVNQKPARLDVKKRVVPFESKKSVFREPHNFSGNEECWHKELREEFERGDFDHLYGSYKKLLEPLVLPLPVSESEECVTRRVIKSLMPKKVFSRDQAQEFYDFIGSWRACVEVYGIEMPKDCLIAIHYIEKLLEKKSQTS